MLRVYVYLVATLFLLPVLRASGKSNSVVKRKQSKVHDQNEQQWGTVSGSVRFRFEGYRLGGAQYPYPSWASTLRLSLRYETPSLRDWSVVVEPEAVLPLGPHDYDVPGLPSQNWTGHPPILDPLGLALNQGFLRWRHTIARTALELRFGRQELMLNDGRFVSNSAWRQRHQSFDGASVIMKLPARFTARYAFANHVNTILGSTAVNGRPAITMHFGEVAWKTDRRINVSLYSLLVNYHKPTLAGFSTATVGVRASGPYKLTRTWSIPYTAEIARQTNFGTNPNRVDAVYGVAELGAAYKKVGIKTGYVLVGAKSATDKLSNSLGQPENGWSELFFANPGVGASQGLRARYLAASGPAGIRKLSFTGTLYDYRSDTSSLHYGREMDAGLKYEVPEGVDRWTIGFGLGRYWADHLFTNALRGWVYTSVSF